MGWHQPRRWRREETPIYEAWSLIFLALSMLVGVMTGRWLETQRSSAIAGSAKERLDRALSEAESIKNRLLSDAESEIRVQRSHLDAESTKRREEIVQNERRLSQREEILEQRTQKLEQQQELKRRASEKLTPWRPRPYCCQNPCRRSWPRSQA